MEKKKVTPRPITQLAMKKVKKTGRPKVEMSDDVRDIMIKAFPTHSNEEVGKMIGYSPSYVQQLATSLGLKKSKSYVAEARRESQQKAVQTHADKCAERRAEGEEPLNLSEYVPRMSEEDRQYARRIQAKALGSMVRRGEAVAHSVTITYKAIEDGMEVPRTFVKHFYKVIKPNERKLTVEMSDE